jgi:hypothetical protein
MTQHITEALVRTRLDELLQSCRANDTRPSVLALASKVGLSNTTFRRRFPEIARELGEHRTPATHTAPTGPSPYDTLVARNAKLRRSNHELKAQLKLAAAQIQYLALRNDHLQRTVEEQSSVTRLDTRLRRV